MNNFSVSNIAWQYPDRLTAYDILQKGGFFGLEIAPGILFADQDDPFVPSDAAVKIALGEIADHGLKLVSMQSLLFGVQGASLFGDDEERATFRTGMTRAITLAGRIGIPNLVFGSPNQRRVPEGMEAGEARAIAHQVFDHLADQAAAAGTQIALEFNPPAYGANFLTDFTAVQDYLDGHSHKALKMCFDLGGIYMNQDNGQLDDFVRRGAAHIGHVHISAPDLAPAPYDVDDTAQVLHCLRAIDYKGFISIEMKGQPDLFPDHITNAVAGLNKAQELSS